MTASIAIRIDRQLYDQARNDARAEHRTISGQVEYWARVGRTALDNPDLPVFDFAGVLDLISMGEWALALRVLCTQVCETGTHLTPTNLANIQQAGHTLNIDTTTLLQKNPPDVMSKCSAIVTGLRRRVKMLRRSGRAGDQNAGC